MADINGLTELAQVPFHPLTAAALRELIEGFPEFWRLMAGQLRGLADWMDAGDAQLGGTAGWVADMAEAAGAVRDAAEQAALEFGEESRFWLAG